MPDSGNAYVVGRILNSSNSDYSWGIVRVNASGKQDWNKSINFSGSSETPQGVAWVNRSNTIIVSGYSYSQGGAYAVQTIASFNTTDGTQLWNVSVNFSATTNNVAYQVDVFNESAYIVGYRVSGDYVFTLLKLNTTSGAQMCNSTNNFSARITSGDNEIARDVVVDIEGNAYAVGTVTEPGGNNGWAVAKYNPSCVVQWNRTAKSSEHSELLTRSPSEAYGVAIFNNTHIIVVGNDGEGFTVTATYSGTQIRIAKYNMSNGALEWTTGADIHTSEDALRAVTVDSSGYIYGGGYYSQEVVTNSNAWYITKYANYSSNQTILYVNSTGKVGILTTNPQAELDVNGRIFQRGFRLFADIAEDYPVSDNASYGDVVVWDSERPMHVKKSIGRYNPNIAGVLSENPGYRIYAGRDDWKALALVGRVPVKVSGENGEIKIGDLLTSSSMQGVAMKATEPGATLGIALEDFNASGTGKILTYVKVEQGYIEMFRKYEKEISELRREIEEMKRR